MKKKEIIDIDIQWKIPQLIDELLLFPKLKELEQKIFPPKESLKKTFIINTFFRLPLKKCKVFCCLCIINGHIKVLIYIYIFFLIL